MVSVKEGSRFVDFMVDTGAQYSVLTKPLKAKSNQAITIVGATGNQTAKPFLQPQECQIGGKTLTHQFIYVPECPIPLLGCDFLAKIQAQVTFTPKGAELKLPPEATGIVTVTVPREQAWQMMMALSEINPHEQKLQPLPKTLQAPLGVWAEDNPPSMAKNIAPIVVALKPGARPVAIQQYRIPRQAAEGIQIHINRLLKYGLLKRCQSFWNTPLLPVGKPNTNDYRPVQDLREVNRATETLHPNVPNPYNILGLIPAEATVFTVLDLKDAFFCCQLAPQSQPIFAFQWADPHIRSKGQLTWTCLPQGFKNSPTLLGTALAQDLAKFSSVPREKVSFCM
uniref:ribonuclease H n=1 Tax=Podarcis muralis TaxID=64176 RepID=A0A670HND9_PODMU